MSLPARDMDTRLREAFQTRIFDIFYSLIAEKPSVFNDIDTEIFADTLLHVATSTRLFFFFHIYCDVYLSLEIKLGGEPSFEDFFDVEIMNLKPSFSRKLNQIGFSPLHLALQNEQIQMVLWLVNIDKSLVRVKGRDGITPLHFVTRQGNLYLLIHFLNACPECIKDVNVRGETALHKTVRNTMLEALEVLLGWLQKNHHQKAKY
ncbi:hypothetical protein REPUB_Repub03eG0203500 [Reevesia pubescens]